MIIKQLCSTLKYQNGLPNILHSKFHAIHPDKKGILNDYIVEKILLPGTTDLVTWSETLIIPHLIASAHHWVCTWTNFKGTSRLIRIYGNQNMCSTS
jgi:hypothetical protein